MKMKEKKPRRGRDYEALLNRLQNCSSAREARALHKEFRQYGDGLPLCSRYPNLPIWVSVAAIIFTVVCLVIKIAG